jgi:hypothetical protein
MFTLQQTKEEAREAALSLGFAIYVKHGHRRYPYVASAQPPHSDAEAIGWYDGIDLADRSEANLERMKVALNSSK